LQITKQSGQFFSHIMAMGNHIQKAML
jgi:hypothetical protein